MKYYLRLPELDKVKVDTMSKVSAATRRVIRKVRLIQRKTNLILPKACVIRALRYSIQDLLMIKSFRVQSGSVEAA